jgi:hypothetical protein
MAVSVLIVVPISSVSRHASSRALVYCESGGVYLSAIDELKQVASRLSYTRRSMWPGLMFSLIRTV